MIDDEYRKQGLRVFGQTEDGVCLGEFLKQTPSGHDLKDRKIFKLGRCPIAVNLSHLFTAIS